MDPDDWTLAGVKKGADFRCNHGRFVWTVDGVDYATQCSPPYLGGLSHSPDTLIAQMDYVRVDCALLHVNPIMGFLNDYHADCVQRYPDSPCRSLDDYLEQQRIWVRACVCALH